MLGLAGAAGLAALAAAALWRDAPATAPTVAAAAPAAARSAWDRAIAGIGDAAPAAPARADDMPGRPALAAIELRPEVVNGAVAGYAIGGNVPPALAEAGLRAGDVLTGIDGLPIDAARARRLAAEFGGLDDVEVTYTRGGEPRDTLIVFRQR